MQLIEGMAGIDKEPEFEKSIKFLINLFRIDHDGKGASIFKPLELLHGVCGRSFHYVDFIPYEGDILVRGGRMGINDRDWVRSKGYHLLNALDGGRRKHVELVWKE